LPLYPYRCTQCGHRFEKIQKFNAKPETVCPKCGGALERPLTAPGLQFKGAGWYVTDYSAKGGGSAEAEANPGEKKPEAKGEAGKSEAVAETKSETKAAGKAESSAPSSGSSGSSASSSSAAS